jgi:DNA/RNA endonuclease YhcR with UshA esterase domain
LFWLVLVCALADEPISPDDARDYVGKEVTVRMVVKWSKVNQADPDIVGYLAADEDFKNGKHLTIVILEGGDSVKGFDRRMKLTFVDLEGKTIEVTGTVKLEYGKPRIRVVNPKQIKVVGDKK